MQDSNPPISQLADGLAMGLLPCSQFVVVAPSPGRPLHGTKGPLVESVGESLVASVTRENDL